MFLQGKTSALVAVSAILVQACASNHELPSARTTAAVENNHSSVPAAQPPIDYHEVAASPSEASQYYVVKKGDTLWDISAHFLKSPWRWPEIWYVNPQVKNPHLIYPGDEVSLDWVDGKPRLRINATEKEAKLAPRIRATNDRIRAIPSSAINRFLQQPRFVPADTAKFAPYVLAIENERLLGASGIGFYARGFKQQNSSQYAGEYHVVRLGPPYRSTEGQLLGYEAIVVAQAQVISPADPAVLQVSRDYREVMANDILIPVMGEAFNQDLYPQVAPVGVKGEVIAVYDKKTISGMHDILTVNVGEQHGLASGQIVSLERQVKPIKDQRTGEEVALPNTQLAYGLSFDVQAQYAHLVILQNNQEVLVGDAVLSPAQ